MWVVSANTHFATVNEKRISGVYVSPGSAETLVSRGGITNHYSMAYFLSNISAKNYQNRLMCVEVIVCNISVVFFETQCTYLHRSSCKTSQSSGVAVASLGDCPNCCWATDCKTVCPMLSVRCLSVCDVGILWPNGWMDRDET